MAKGFLIPTVIDSFLGLLSQHELHESFQRRKQQLHPPRPCCCGLVWRPVASLLKTLVVFVNQLPPPASGTLSNKRVNVGRVKLAKKTATVTVPLRVQLALVQNPQQQDIGAFRRRQLQPLLFSAIRSRRAVTESMLAPCNLCVAVIFHPFSSQSFFLNLPSPVFPSFARPSLHPSLLPLLPLSSFTTALISSQSSSNINQSHC